MTEPAATPAATVVALRDGTDGDGTDGDGGAGLEVLMVRRSSRGTFAGMWVFPGGQVDPADGSGDEVTVAARAAAREAEEEAGLRLDPQALVPLSWWMPPAEAPRRFATWFFLTVPAPAEVAVDRVEVEEHRWFAPAEAIALRDKGEIELAPPTWTTLHWLRSRPSAAAAMDDARGRAPERYITRVVLDTDGRGLLATLWEGDVAYDDGDLERPGPRRRLVAAADGWRFEGTQA